MSIYLTNGCLAEFHLLELFLVNAYGRNGMGYEAVDLYERMPTSMRDSISHICVLNACSHRGLVDQARAIFDSIEQPTETIVTTMVRAKREESRQKTFFSSCRLIV